MAHGEIMDLLDNIVMRSCHALCIFISMFTLSLETNKTLFIIMSEAYRHSALKS